MKSPENKHKLIPDENAPTVQRMFKIALAGANCNTIVRTLKAEKIPIPGAYVRGMQVTVIAAIRSILIILRKLYCMTSIGILTSPKRIKKNMRHSLWNILMPASQHSACENSINRFISLIEQYAPVKKLDEVLLDNLIK